MVEQFQDWNTRRRPEDAVEIVDAEKHGDGIEPGSHEADGDGPQDGDGDHLLRARDFLGHVGGAIQAGKGPVRVDQADDKCCHSLGFILHPPVAARKGLTDPVLFPSRVVDKVSKHEASGFMARRFGGDGDENDQKRDERGVEGRRPDGREQFAIAVEDEGKGIHHLIADKDMPRVNGAYDRELA